MTRTSAETSSTSQNTPVVLSQDAKARRSLQLALAAAQVAEEDQGQDIMVLDSARIDLHLRLFRDRQWYQSPAIACDERRH